MEQGDETGTRPERDLVASAVHRFLELQQRESRTHELRRQLEALVGSTSDGMSRQQLGELLMLMLYYGTWLDLREIAALRRAQVEAVEMGRLRLRLAAGRAGSPRSIVLTAEVSAALRALLAAGGTDGELLFRRPDGSPYEEPDVFALARRYGSSLLLEGAEAGPMAFAGSRVVAPIPVRLKAHPGYTGRGVTIALIDSGFYAHPDLVRPTNRIRRYVDLTGQNRPLTRAHDDAWHGTMTAVACAGNGQLSHGLYRGIARDAELVLVAVGRGGRIRPDDVVRAFEWVVEHRQALDIRIVSVSLGGDLPESYRESAIDAAAELAVQAGLLVVAAAGNDPLRPSVPPANAPSVLTVGGIVDKSLPHELAFTPYHSQFGRTQDGLLKPELVAPGALVAAPILPGTETFDLARKLYLLQALPDDELRHVLRRPEAPDLGEDWPSLDDEALRERVEERVDALKLVGPHYQHVDGTSFAAPIVASVAAQMCEARPSLTPRAVREILIGTARVLPHVPRERQGYGLIRAADAVLAAESPVLPAFAQAFDTPEVRGNRARFELPGPELGRVSLAGTFNQWDGAAQPLLRRVDGVWETTLDVPLPGRHAYKFVVDDRYWIEDPANPRTEPDGYGGFNSVFEVAEHAAGQALADEVFPGLHGDDPEARATALSALDFVLALPNAAANPAVERYHGRCLEHAAAMLERPAEADTLEIVQLYNCGTILRVPGLSVGIDVVTTRHVWGLNWRVPEELVAGLADGIDVLLATQRLPDHLDLDLVREILARGGCVMAPEDVRSLVAPSCLGLAPGAERRLDTPGGTLVVMAHRAVHWRDVEGRVTQNGYALELGGWRVVHLADHDHTRYYEGPRGADVLVATVGRFGPTSDPAVDARALVARASPRLLVPTHLAELGQPGYAEDGGYDAVARWLRDAGTETEVLSWGERRVRRRG